MRRDRPVGRETQQLDPQQTLSAEGSANRSDQIRDVLLRIMARFSRAAQCARPRCPAADRSRSIRNWA
jgi:hypothetical protein